MLEDSALFPFVGDIGPELTEGVGEGEEEDFSVKVDDAEDFFHISEEMDDAGASEENNDDASDGNREELATADDSVSPDPLLLSPTSQDPAANNDEVLSSEESLSSSIPLLEQRRASSAHGNSGTLGPLANLRPERYKNANVKDFFPEFRENAPLRFSKLFPVKDSLKPSIWKRLRKRKAREEAEHSSEDGQMAVKKERRGWVKDYAPIEDFVLAECDSVRY